VTELTEMYRRNISRQAGMRRFLLSGGKTSFEPFVGMNKKSSFFTGVPLMPKKVVIGKEKKVFMMEGPQQHKTVLSVMMVRELLQLAYRVKERIVEACSSKGFGTKQNRITSSAQ